MTDLDDAPSPTPASDATPPAEAHSAVRGLGEATPEVQVGDASVHVTLDIRPIAAGDLDYFVGSNLVLLWSRSEPEEVCSVVRLPVSVVPAECVVTVTNGVFDLTAPRDPLST
ncbi:MAG: hypothetical protein KY455_12330 [Euryarchaeota archaeon]|nr:hypothetical protein [Euryarchaeota archaeon]